MNTSRGQYASEGLQISRKWFSLIESIVRIKITYYKF